MIDPADHFDIPQSTQRSGLPLWDQYATLCKKLGISVIDHYSHYEEACPIKGQVVRPRNTIEVLMLNPQLLTKIESPNATVQRLIELCSLSAAQFENNSYSGKPGYFGTTWVSDVEDLDLFAQEVVMLTGMNDYLSPAQKEALAA